MMSIGQILGCSVYMLGKKEVHLGKIQVCFNVHIAKVAIFSEWVGLVSHNQGGQGMLQG